MRYKPYSVRRQERRSKNRLLSTIIIGGALFYILLAWVLPSLIGGLSVLNQFKPTPKVTPPIAESAVLAPPVLSIPYEATNSSKIRTKGYSSSESKIEIYLDDELKDTVEARKDGSFLSNSISLSLGTNNIYGKTINDSSKSLPSKTIQLIYDNERPKLDLKEPSDNQTIKGGDKKVKVSGQTGTKNGISVTVNGTRAIVDQDGNFSQTLDISEGDNDILVVVTDLAGNTNRVSRKVTYQL